VIAARSALAADPTDAETYILLGAALQDTGRWAESMFVFATCVQKAKRGPLDDCRALARP
jgi:Flp pilus assembly protein TadD